ncbi:MAG: glycosyltransferase family 2 protein [Bacteroidetes bacterium]|nr:glycosyltransferase family 2 protein [Bacteroidota bacterium]
MKDENNLKYSVVVPVFNSEDTLGELFERINGVFDHLQKSFEVIFIEDGGKDSSWNKLLAIKKNHPDKVVAIKLAKNYGQHNATFCGLNHAKGNFIITIDDDLQNPPEEIEKLIAGYNESQADLIYGLYSDKKQSRLRKFYSTSFNRSSRAFVKGHGKGSSFRLITRELADSLLNHHQNFLFLDELFLWYARDISFVSVKHEERKFNRSGYNGFRLMRLFANIILYYSNVPLKIMVYGGLIFSSFTFLIGLFFVVKKIFFNVPILGYTSLIVAIMFSTGIIVFSLGIIGEYLSRIYMVQSKKPPYMVKKII